MPTRARHRPQVVVQDLDDDVCLYRPDIDEVVVLNASAGDVWRLADGELTLDELVDRLAAAHQLSSETIAADVHRTYQDLLERGYLIPVDAVPVDSPVTGASSDQTG